MRAPDPFPIDPARIRYPEPPPEPAVLVEALEPSWCVGGRPVTPGERYAIPLAEALRLCGQGKAARI